MVCCMLWLLHVGVAGGRETDRYKREDSGDMLARAVSILATPLILSFMLFVGVLSVGW